MEQCVTCKHQRPLSGGCAAYPDGDGIPFKFSSDMEAHNKPEPGQTGTFVFEEGEPDEIKQLSGK